MTTTRTGSPPGVGARAGTRPLRTAADLQTVLPRPLDPEQLAAATAPLTPGLVVAGAGSGKTTVMAARVVWLVGSGQVAPERVLGLTFTNKAAAELASRVRDWLAGSGVVADGEGGEDRDAEPTVSTYHAFAGQLVRDHGIRIGIEPDARTITDATRFMLAMRAMREVEAAFSALEVGPDFIAERVLALAGELAEHLVPLDHLRARDREIIASVGAVAKPTVDVIKVATTAQQRLELATLVEAYTRAKRDRDLVDFDDQIALAARLAAERGEVVAACRAAYDVVLLDEYQDTSVAQRILLTRLFGAGHPVTAVGDPFQAIYGWRGASVANIEDFPRHFAAAAGDAAATYPLPVSYRSGGRLLDLANRLARPLRADHPDVQPLRVPAGGDPAAGWVRCGVLETAAEEVAFVVDEVRGARERGAAAAWSDIAVLVRQNSVIAPISARLTAAGGPVEVVGLRGLVTLPGVADVVATLQVIHDPTANPAALRLLAGPRWRIGPRDLRLLAGRAAALAKVPSEPPPVGDDEASLARALDAAVAASDPAELLSLLDALEDPGDLPYSSEARERFARLAAEIEELRGQPGEALVDLIDRVIVTSGLDVEAAIGPVSRGTAQRDALAALLDVAAAFRDLDGESTLGSFLAYLAAAEQEDAGLDLPTPTFGDSVKLMSIHRAKGLEWDVVVLPELTRSVFPSARGRSRYTQAAHVMPVSLRGDASRVPEVGGWTKKDIDDYKAALKADDLREERRLGYVAITRARKLLVASTAWWGPTQKTLRGPSEFFEIVRAHCEEGNGEVVVAADPPPDGAANPVLDSAGAEVAWPAPLNADLLAARRAAAAAVRAAMASDAVAGASTQVARATPDEATPDQATPDQATPDQATVDGWDHDLELLVAEVTATSGAIAHEVPLPATLSASRLIALQHDPDRLAAELARPVPREPRPAARRGTRLHAWIESRLRQQPLVGPEELPGALDADIVSDDDLIALQEAFERGPYADRVPYRLEAPFSLVLAGRVVRGRIDAVFQIAADRYEVVDWKTSRAHDADPLQLAIYRLAWSEIAGVPLSHVDAAFAYLRDGAVDHPPDLPGRPELEALLTTAPTDSRPA
jgi:DNA helicase-2/ATP-dependent DNA helicase PcrA